MKKIETLGKAQPFLKWAGGKTQLLSELVKYAPQKYGTYFEPFLGVELYSSIFNRRKRC